MSHLRPVSDEERRRRRHERRLKRISMLPAMFTLGNLLFGFAAICCCLLSVKADGGDLAKQTLGSQRLNSIMPTYLAIGAMMIAFGLVCDGLDGRVARWARKTSDFGAQLDSLADAVTFGAAPGLLMVCLAMDLRLPSRWPAELVTVGLRATWLMGAVYASCAAIRLARFNVENVHDESSHYWFKGLPTPGAAGVIAALVLFHENVMLWLPGLAAMVQYGLPPVTLVCGLLMVSRIRYAHLVNHYLAKKRPLSHLVLLLIVILSIFIKPVWGLAIGGITYVFSGPVIELIRLGSGRRQESSSADTSDEQADEGTSSSGAG